MNGKMQLSPVTVWQLPASPPPPLPVSELRKQSVITFLATICSFHKLDVEVRGPISLSNYVLISFVQSLNCCPTSSSILLSKGCVMVMHHTIVVIGETIAVNEVSSILVKLTFAIIFYVSFNDPDVLVSI